MTLIKNTLLHVVSFLVATLFVVMFIFIISSSLRQPGTPFPRTLQWIPNPISVGNYTRIFNIIPLAQFMLNSAIVVAFAIPITILTASWAGFAMAQLESQLRNALVLLAVLLLLIPVTALWLTRFIVITHLGLIDTLTALILPALMGTSPLFVLLFYWSFRRFPLELYESAQLDGANALMIWARIALPLAKPTIAVVAVLTFVTYWGDFINPLLYLKSESRYTITMGLKMLQSLDKTNWSLLMAGVVVMVTPSVLLFLLVQRYFWVEGQLSVISGRNGN